MYSTKLINMKVKLFALAVLLSFTGCEHPWDCTDGHGPIVVQELALDEINGIQLMGSDKVYLSIGEEQEIIVEGQQNIINELNTRVVNEHWEIRFRDCVRDHQGLKFYITVRELDEIKLSGSGEIVWEDLIEADYLTVEIDGSGEITGMLQAQQLNMDIAGSGNLNLSGQASDADLHIAGSGKLRGYDLEVDNYHVEIAGSGNADITVVETLEVDIAGSGSVNYKGNPSIDSNISGSGKITNKN